MSELIYKPNNGQNTAATVDAIMELARPVNGRSRTRILYRGDAQDILNTLDAHPDCTTARSYSRDGFVPNAYKYPADIVCAEATKRTDGTYAITVIRVGAKRSRGEGALITVNGRAL